MGRRAGGGSGMGEGVCGRWAGRQCRLWSVLRWAEKQTTAAGGTAPPESQTISISHKGQLSVSHAAARNSSVQHPALACLALGCSACCQLLAEPSSAAWHSSARWVLAAGRIRASRLLLRTALAIDPSEPPPLPLVCGAAADVQSSLARPPAVS